MEVEVVAGVDIELDVDVEAELISWVTTGAGPADDPLSPPRTAKKTASATMGRVTAARTRTTRFMDGIVFLQCDERLAAR
jgi:hypothetical protein